MFGFREIDSIERFRLASLKLVIVLLVITLMTLLSSVVLPEYIVVQMGVGLPSILLLFSLMASLVFIAQFFMGSRQVFDKIALTMYILLTTIFIIGTGSMFFSMSRASSVNLNTVVSIVVFMAVLWGAMTLIKMWVETGARLTGIYSELGL
ncbi:hypothetical protein [Methanocella sp. MCL-LM]|uniref:hypothetical protein n=1 Tax=Methanocella sp. MCL-LM TaxID=3412035 RepID=UPI003C762177